jgi:hypothetical protein
MHHIAQSICVQSYAGGLVPSEHNESEPFVQPLTRIPSSLSARRSVVASSLSSPNQKPSGPKPQPRERIVPSQAPSLHRLDGVVGGRRGPAPQELPRGGQRGRAPQRSRQVYLFLSPLCPDDVILLRIPSSHGIASDLVRFAALFSITCVLSDVAPAEMLNANFLLKLGESV